MYLSCVQRFWKVMISFSFDSKNLFFKKFFFLHEFNVCFLISSETHWISFTSQMSKQFSSTFFYCSSLALSHYRLINIVYQFAVVLHLWRLVLWPALGSTLENGRSMELGGKCLLYISSIKCSVVIRPFNLQDGLALSSHCWFLLWMPYRILTRLF